jgi:DNA-binding NarL/FixJ family response regulator
MSDPAVVGRVFEGKQSQTANIDMRSLPDLTGREAEVLKLSALGYTGKEIARQVAVGVKTIETYKSRGMEKLGLATRAELVRFAAVQGWLSDI